MIDFIIWGMLPGNDFEEPLYIRSTTLEQAEAMEQHLINKQGVKNTRIAICGRFQRLNANNCKTI